MFEYGLSIEGTEWVIIIFLGLILILGTGRLPGAARKIGRMLGEYNKAKSGIEEHVRGIQDEAGQFPRVSGPVESEREKLETIARSAGISADGKSDDKLREMISQKMGGGAQKGPARPAAGPASSSSQSPPSPQRQQQQPDSTVARKDTGSSGQD